MVTPRVMGIRSTWSYNNDSCWINMTLWLQKPQLGDDNVLGTLTAPLTLLVYFAVLPPSMGIEPILNGSLGWFISMVVSLLCVVQLHRLSNTFSTPAPKWNCDVSATTTSSNSLQFRKSDPWVGGGSLILLSFSLWMNEGKHNKGFSALNEKVFFFEYHPQSK